MGTTLERKVQRLPPKGRATVEARACKLIIEEQLRRAIRKSRESREQVKE